MLVNKSEKEVFKGIKYEWDEVLDEKLVSFMDEKEAEENGPRYNRRHLIDLVRFVRNTLIHVKEEKFPGDVKVCLLQPTYQKHFTKPNMNVCVVLGHRWRQPNESGGIFCKKIPMLADGSSYDHQESLQ